VPVIFNGQEALQRRKAGQTIVSYSANSILNFRIKELTA
jgi:hypothetical protein